MQPEPQLAALCWRKCGSTSTASLSHRQTAFTFFGCDRGLLILVRTVAHAECAPLAKQLKQEAWSFERGYEDILYGSFIAQHFILKNHVRHWGPITGAARRRDQSIPNRPFLGRLHHITGGPCS
jgi:hypothetical protein